MKRLQTLVAILTACSVISACGSRGEDFAKRLTEIMHRSDAAAGAEAHGATLLVHSLKDSCTGFLKLVLKGEFGSAREITSAELRESGFVRAECRRADGTIVGVELSKLDLAYDTVKRYALEAYPSWVAYTGQFCPNKLEVLNEYTNLKNIFDPWGGTYRMRCGGSLPTAARGFGVFSPGEDLQEGTEDDVLSWE